MALSGITAIDNLFGGQNEPPIVTGSPNGEAVGLIQDLLSGHGAPGMPGLQSASRGKFGPATTKAVRKFQAEHNLPVIPASDPQVATVDGATLRALAIVPTGTGANPKACRGYLTLALDFPFTGMLKVMSLTTEFEGGGKFTAQNKNTDEAGLSYGLIQWAQKPTRLTDILKAFQAEQPQQFVSIFGEGDANLAQRLINHTKKPNGGVTSAGVTTDAAFNLIKNPWSGRFTRAGLSQELQRVQVTTALTAFNASFQRLQGFAPRITSERGVAFMLDLANQFGDGGAKNIFQTVNSPNLSDSALLQAMADESVSRMASQFRAGTRARRQAFIETPFLSDGPFNPN